MITYRALCKKRILLINSAPSALYSAISSSFCFARSSRILCRRTSSIDDKQRGIVTYSQNCCGVPLRRSNENLNFTKSLSFRSSIRYAVTSRTFLCTYWGISFNISSISCFQSKASRFKRGFIVYKLTSFIIYKCV